MKTALTELLEYLQKDYDGLEMQKTEVSKIFKIAIATVMKNIEDLYLSKEKEQITRFALDFYQFECRYQGIPESQILENLKRAEKHFERTFKSDE